MALDTVTSLDYMIEDLRFYLGDVALPYRYLDNHLRHGLVMACKALMKKWRNRYVIDANYDVSRNPTASFYEAEPPVIERADERAFILQAAIIIKSAGITVSATSIGSWRDDEIAYSNIASARAQDRSLLADIEELELWLRTRLYGSARQSLPGFRLPVNPREGYR